MRKRRRVRSREGAKVVRHGYDRRAILSVADVAAGPVQSLFAYFAPDWPAKAKKVVDGRTVYLVGVEAADDAAAAKPGSSVAWAEEILQNRLRQIRSRVEREAGAAAPNALAERMETPLTGGADANWTSWPYGHSRSTYETERHVRW